MSDGSSGSPLSGSFEFINEKAQQGAKAVGGTVASFGKTAAQQVGGTGGIAGQQPQMSGSFDLKSGIPQSGDLFSPDKKGTNPPPQSFGNTKPLTQAGQAASARADRVYTPEELDKIQRIEQELKNMHAEYFEDFRRKAEGKNKQQQLRPGEQATQDAEEKKEMVDLQKKEEKKLPLSVQQGQQSAEVKGIGG